MTTADQTVTVSLTKAEVSALIGSARRSTRGIVRGVATKLREQVELPLSCPATFKTPQADACGDFSELEADKREDGLTVHLQVAHDYPEGKARFHARRGLKAWDPNAELSPTPATSIAGEYDTGVYEDDDDED